MKTAMCVVAAVLAVVCAHQAAGAPFSLSSDEFPIVMMGLASRVRIESIATDLRCDYVHIYTMCNSTNQADLDYDRLFFDEAAANGVKVMACLRAWVWVDRTDGLQQMLACVAEFKDHPALGYWYLFDEPDNHGIPPAVAQQYYEAVKQESPGVLVANAHAWTTGRLNYANAQDIHTIGYAAVADEPFPDAPVDYLPNLVEDSLDEGQPVIPILQCWKRGDGMRFPNRVELRYSAYACTVLGVRGVSWYAHELARDGGDETWLDGTLEPMLSNFREFVDAVEPAHNPDKVHGGGSDAYFLATWVRGSDKWVVLVNDRNYARSNETFSMGGTISEADLWPLDGTRAGNEQIRSGTIQSLSLGPWESCVWKAIPVGLNIPGSMQATPKSPGRIDLTWADTSSFETGFKIDRHPGDGHWIRIGAAAANETIYRDAVGLAAESTHSYRVKAYNASGNGLHGSAASATTLTGIDLRPAAADDDAEETAATGQTGFGSTDLELVTESGADKLVGIRFPNVPIPRGATIHAAHLQFTVDETTSEATTLLLRAQAVDDAPAFVASDYNISARATTGVSVSWSPAAWNTEGTCGANQRSPDLAGLVQAIVDRPGWTRGNALALIVTGTGKRVAESWNGATNAAPFLHVYCSTAHVDLQPASDADDAEESVASGTIFPSSTDLELVNDGGTVQLVGIRFPGVSIPQGAAIQTATLQFTADETGSDPTSLTLRGQAIDNAPAFTNVLFNISGRTTTGESVAWAPAAWNNVGQRGADQRTPDLAGLIQAIVDRPGWTYGNALALIVTGTGTRTAVSATGTPGGAPSLHVRYHCSAQSFVAYNDLAWFGGQLSSGITRFTTTKNFPSGNPEGCLHDYETDQPLPIRVTVQGGASPQEEQGLDPSPSTDAFYVFNSKVNCAGAIGYATDDLVLTLTGLTPQKSYEFALYSDRNGAGYTGGASRYQHATLSGADSFVNASTPGTTILADSVPDDTTLYNAGYNNPYGFVTRFTRIDPGVDGMIAVTLARNTNLSYYTYANAFMLAGHDVVKVARGASWKYRKGTAEASNPPTEWRTRTFDDAAWTGGDTPFGYGDGPYRTTLDDMFGNYTCIYLRKAFWLDQPTRISQLELRVLFDDGFIAWINGVEIGRTNVPGGFLPFDGAALSSIEPATHWRVVLEGRFLPLLVAGSNILAIQSFNGGPFGSDLTLDCSLMAAENERVLQDADGDGMPDPWEIDVFGGASVSNAATELDFDGDGLLNIQEFIAGTDPDNVADLFTIDVNGSAGGVIVSLQGKEATGAGYEDVTRYYAIEQRPVLDDVGVWSAATGCDAVHVTGQATIAYTNSASDPMTLYRGRVWLESQ